MASNTCTCFIVNKELNIGMYKQGNGEDYLPIKQIIRCFHYLCIPHNINSLDISSLYAIESLRGRRVGLKRFHYAPNISV